MAQTPEQILQAQINRFAGPAVPLEVRFLSAPLPITGVIDMTTALTALIIAQKRAADAFARYRDNVSTDVLVTASTGFANPVGYVTGHLGDLITIVSNYADAKGLGRASGFIATLRSHAKPLAIAGGLAIGYFLFMRRSR